MKVLAIAAIFATLVLSAIAQDGSSPCPEQYRDAMHNVMDVCHPVLRKYMKGPGGPGGSGSPENRKKRQDDDQDTTADVEACLTKIKAEEALADIVATCSGSEDEIVCIFKEFKKVCPPPPRSGKPPNHQ